MANPAISRAVAESAKLNPDNYKKYSDTIENEFGRAFRADLADVNKMVTDPSLNDKYGGVHFAWNDQNGHFILVDKNNRELQRSTSGPGPGVYTPTGITGPYVNRMLDKMDNINRGIDSLKSVYDNDPTNPNKDVGRYLLGTLQNTGFRPGENITNASEGMAKAIIKTKKPDITLEQLDKVLGLTK